MPLGVHKFSISVWKEKCGKKTEIFKPGHEWCAIACAGALLHLFLTSKNFSKNSYLGVQ